MASIAITATLLYFATLYFARHVLHFARTRNFRFGKIIFGRGSTAISPGSEIKISQNLIWRRHGLQITYTWSVHRVASFICKTRRLHNSAWLRRFSIKPVPKWSVQRGASFICKTWNLHNSTWLRPIPTKPVLKWSVQRGASFTCKTWRLHNSTWLRPFRMKPVLKWSVQRGASFICKTWRLHNSTWLRPFSMKPVPELRLHALNFARLRNDWFCVCSFLFFC